MNGLDTNTHACNYCTGCDIEEECVAPLRHYGAFKTFHVDGIAYHPYGGDVSRQPMIAAIRDTHCTGDECDCDGYLQAHSNPPTETELDWWTTSTWGGSSFLLPQATR